MKHSWTYLTNHIKTGGFTGEFTRSKGINANYTDFKKTLAGLNMTLSRYIAEVYLRDGGYTLQKNRFPYDLKPGIDHYVLFADGPRSARFITNKIRSTFPGLPTLWFVNTPEKQSVKEVWHCHIFVNRNEG